MHSYLNLFKDGILRTLTLYLFLLESLLKQLLVCLLNYLHFSVILCVPSMFVHYYYWCAILCVPSMLIDYLYFCAILCVSSMFVTLFLFLCHFFVPSRKIIILLYELNQSNNNFIHFVFFVCKSTEIVIHVPPFIKLNYFTWKLSYK